MVQEIDFSDLTNAQLEERIAAMQALLERRKALSESIQERLCQASISKDAPVNEKIQFFMDLFKARTDVYAKRSLKDGKKSYYRVCANSFVDDLCSLKPGIKGVCKGCKNSKNAPLTAKVVYRNNWANDDLDANGAIGVYTPCFGDTCHWLAIDFDKSSWKDDCLAVKRKAQSLGLEMGLERSCSGNGAHLWLFFSEPVKACDAHNLAKKLLVMSEMDLDSFDRIFPLHDSVPKDGSGYGSLIQLPLVKSAYAKGNTVFVDDLFVMYDDQLRFLSSIPRYSEKDVSAVLASLKNVNPLGFLGSAQDGGEISPEDPTVRNNDSLFPGFDQRHPRMTAKDTVQIELRDGVRIKKSSLSRANLNIFKRLASFPNPQYYEKQRMHQYIPFQECPNILCCAYETKDELVLPRSTMDSLVSLLSSNGIAYALNDNRDLGHKLKLTQKVSLRTEQIPAFNAMKDKDLGILNAATSFGKTAVASALIAYHQVSALILVHQVNLMDQWMQKLDDYLCIDVSELKRPKGKRKKIYQTGIGFFRQKTDYRTGLVDVMMVPSLSVKQDFMTLTAGYGLVIIDECHHGASQSFETILRGLQARYIYGLSATVQRKDGLEKITHLYLGPVLYKAEAAKLAYQRGIRQYFITHFVPFYRPLSRMWTIQDAYRIIGQDDKRNQLIVKEISLGLEDGHTILVLFHTIEHLNSLAKMLDEKKTIKAYSAVFNKDTLSSIPDNSVILATETLMGEGVDIPNLDTLVLASPVSWRGRVAQFAGRIGRYKEGKKAVFIHDFVDIGEPMLESMYKKRQAAYKELGFVNLSTTSERSVDCLLENPELTARFLNDLDESTSSIVINASCADNSQVNETVKAKLEEARRRGVSVELDLHEGLNYAAIDRKLVYFGSVSLLNLDEGNQNQAMLRFIDSRVAIDLIENRQDLF